MKEEEATGELDIGSLKDPPGTEREPSRGVLSSTDFAAPQSSSSFDSADERTIMRKPRRDSDATRLDVVLPTVPPPPMAPPPSLIPTTNQDSVIVVEDYEIESEVDPDDIDEVDDEDERESERDTASTAAGTSPGHEVAQALRAMMLEEGVTQTRLPEELEAEAPSPETVSPRSTIADAEEEDEALPAFSLDEPVDESTAWPPPQWRVGAPAIAPTTRRLEGDLFSAARAANDDAPESVSVSTARKPVPSALLRETTTATTATAAPAPSTKRKPEVPTAIETAETTVVFSGPLPSMAMPSVADPAPAEDLVLDTRESFGIVADETGPMTGLSPPSMSNMLPADEDDEEPEDHTVFRKPEPELIAATKSDELDAYVAKMDVASPPTSRETSRSPGEPKIRASFPSIDTSAFDEEASVATAAPIRGTMPDLAPPDAVDEDEIEELAEDSFIEEPAQPPPSAAATAPPAKPVAKSSWAPKAAPLVLVRKAHLENPDAEERELIEEQRWGPLVAVYRQRLGATDIPPRQAEILLKIASVYEYGMHDQVEAFNALIDAFEAAPGNEAVITEVDRLGREAGRIGELADRVRKRLLPASTDEKRVIYLGHLIFWYERVLSRAGEVSSFVSDLERHDKNHPIVLRRQAQLAAMNGDIKGQRELLGRALERSSRREDQVALNLALANAWATTPEQVKFYEGALAIDPSSLVALQGIKRLGKEKENYPQVQWALERQAEVAPTETERIDALVELAELQETKFLKREVAAQLLEQVLDLEPAHPNALKTLERCYHALREWGKLARILSIRAEHSFEKTKKVELLEMAAEVHESKLSDPAGAIEVYRNLLVVEPKHRRALGDLARLYEKLGDWSNVATYKARLAELAPSKRLSSQELVKLGDFLSAPDRDPIAGKLQYERAVAVDPSNGAAWEALQRLAAAAGDDRRVIECLEQRRDHTDVPRQRAIVLVELAHVHLNIGDDDAARKCFEDAVHADPSNEPAAIAMLDAYTAEEQWGAAAPLCELLVNAAIRDRDGEALFVRLRLATRIAAALGDAERAMTSAIAALDARPKDPGAQADLIAVASQLTARERAREPAARIAESPEGLPTEMLLQLAALQREFSDEAGAARTLEHARQLAPDDRELLRTLSDVYLAQDDFTQACAVKTDLARTAPDDDTRFELLIDIGEIWARRAQEMEKAATVFEEARAIKPSDAWLLETLEWIYAELGEWQHMAAVLEDLIQVHDEPDAKVKTLLSLAEVCREKLEDRARAADLLDEALDVDRKRLDVFEELVRLFTADKDWEKLERSYRKMIARVKDDDEPELQFLLFQQLGLIYRDRLADASRAFDALDAASRLQPENAEVRKIVIELLVITDNLDNAVTRLREEIDRDPHEPQLYAELYELFLRQHYFDKAWCVVNVLARLREPTPDQRRFHEDYAPVALDRVPGQIVEQAWASHICHRELDTNLTTLFAALAPAAARMRHSQLRPDQRASRPFTQAHSRLHDAIRSTFSDASEILAVPMPELLVAEAATILPFTAAFSPVGAVHVAAAPADAQSASLIYLVGKKLAELRPELLARALFPSTIELQAVFAAAQRVTRQEAPKDAAAAGMDASLSAALSPKERDVIRSALMKLPPGPPDIRRWLQLADLSSMRSGLLLAGDVEQARLSILAEPTAPQDLSLHDRIGELYRFATSDLYSDLRGAIGVSVST